MQTSVAQRKIVMTEYFIAYCIKHNQKSLKIWRNLCVQNQYCIPMFEGLGWNSTENKHNSIMGPCGNSFLEYIDATASGLNRKRTVSNASSKACISDCLQIWKGIISAEMYIHGWEHKYKIIKKISLYVYRLDENKTLVLCQVLKPAVPQMATQHWRQKSERLTWLHSLLWLCFL